MIAEKALCIALGMVAGLALVEIAGRGFRSIVLHLVTRKLRNDRAARKRLDVTKILESRK